MGIINKFKGMIFGARTENLTQPSLPTLMPQPEKIQQITDAKHSEDFSEDDVLEAKIRAQSAVRIMNESLGIANNSIDRGTREHKFSIVRRELAYLKQIVAKFSAIKPIDLHSFEASIIAVENETRSLPHNELADPSIKDVPDKAQPTSFELQRKEIESPERSGQDQPHFSADNKHAILMCIQSCFRVVNESIAIARKSKNRETQISRIGVARDCLKEAQKQASQFSLKVDGFDVAEAEITRIEEAIRTCAPTEIAGMPHIEVNTEFSSAARNLLKVATALKREKKYIEACEKLRKAYSAEGAENLMIEDRLRLPMYLQLDGRNDEGWDELNRLNLRYLDQFSQPRIANQMRVFLKKEGNENATNPVRLILQGENTPKPLNSALERVRFTMGELQNTPIPSWMNEDYLGLSFSATLQLRTPLRVLLRHDELYLKIDGRQPQIAREPWEGIWLPKPKTFKEMGIDMPEFPQGKHASSIGPILPCEYLPFLIAIRGIVEINDAIEKRIDKLRNMLSTCDWHEYLDKHGGTEKIVQYFFPKFIYLADGLDTPNSIAAASDETLLAIKGIGSAKLKSIRERCACITENRDTNRVDDVFR